MSFLRRTSHKSYRIAADRDEWVTPEQTLVDSVSTLSDVEMPVGAALWRLWIVGVVALSLIIIGGATRLAVFRHDALAQLAWRNRTVDVSVPPPRGIIMDRNGVPLVRNVPSFDLLVVSHQVRRNADGTFPDIAALSAVLNRNADELTLALADGMRDSAVFFLATDITRDQVLTLRSALPSGFSIITSTKRQYIDGPQFAHLIGYVGKVSSKDITSDQYYLPSDTIGRLGVESAYEDVLRGVHGQLVYESSGATTQDAPEPGKNLVLNLSRDVQQALYASVWDVLRDSGLSQAAAVVQDVHTGGVLGLVSFPTYDNNIFSGPLSQADADKLFNNQTHPLLNRIIAGTYNPGSTIKPFLGMSALQEHVMTPGQTVVNNCISLTVPNPNDPQRPYVFDNWRPDTGPFDLNRAIADSCNIYFFTVGGGSPPGAAPFSGLGVQRYEDYLKRGLADSILGIDLPGEGSGFIPTPEWKHEQFSLPWYQGDTYNISIGQGDLSVTPLWINTYVAAIANGGTLWRPQVATRVVDDQKNTLEVFAPQQIGSLPFSQDVIATMRTAMRYTVTEGTGKLLKDVPVAVAAKTGTAEVIKGSRINSLLTLYAPADDPQIAMTVLFEGSSSNQGYALHAAHTFLQWYFTPNRQSGTPVPTATASPLPTLAPTASASVGP